MLGLYLHIPFCQALCSYCNFNRGLLDADLKTVYVAALRDEIRQAGDGSGVDTIFFGGGTPSLLDPSEVAALITACHEGYRVTPDAEITLEANPETITEAYLARIREAGVNRVSLGVQSFDDGQLVRLGRIHSAERAAEAVRMARAAGFDNVSFDLMFWLPGQSRQSWLDSVSRAVSLEPDHLSLYLLELYPNAPLKEALARAGALPTAAGPASATDWSQASDDEAADMYLQGLYCLDAAGFEQYEISNVSKPGRPSRHNLKYWTAGSWRGFGCGAHSTVDGRRWKNVAATAEYAERQRHGRSVIVDEIQLTPEQRTAEALFTGLRLNAGIDRARFAEAHHVDPWLQYGRDLASFVDAGYMWITSAGFGLTRSGMLVSNEILTMFV